LLRTTSPAQWRTVDKACAQRMQHKHNRPCVACAVAAREQHVLRRGVPPPPNATAVALSARCCECAASQRSRGRASPTLTAKYVAGLRTTNATGFNSTSRDIMPTRALGVAHKSAAVRMTCVAGRVCIRRRPCPLARHSSCIGIQLQQFVRCEPWRGQLCSQKNRGVCIHNVWRKHRCYGRCGGERRNVAAGQPPTPTHHRVRRQFRRRRTDRSRVELISGSIAMHSHGVRESQ